MTQDEILEAFALLPDWEDRYQLIGDLGCALPAMAAGQKTEANRVKGCNTRAWLAAHLTDDQPPRLELEADAETPLVRGLVALLLIPFRDKTPAEILATDAKAFFAPLGIESALSPSRRAGMHALIARVRALAAAHLQTEGSAGGEGTAEPG
ncbi:MAG: SufE family protein [Thiocapsa sp.]|jgi:cysteine desulfuration protein SufE|nr:SufE family protein [Thiocapsa sp.]MCG6896034.1 SufE family protein [Thiocapsa sp.]MCG6986337.1 SufE family protein [Thiocapsa sp.]